MLRAMYLKALLKKTEAIAFILALCCSYILFPFFFEAAVFPLPGSGPAWNSLDASWNLTLNKINTDNLVWGKDFILTYGPLSYLSTRIGWGVNKYYFLLFDLFTWFNFFYIFYTSYVKSNNKTATALLVVFATLILPPFFGSGTSVILLAFFIYWIRQSIDEPRPLFYILQILLITLLFFVKFNTGLISFVFFFVMLLYKFIVAKEHKLLLSAVCVAPFVTILCVSVPLHVYLPGYLRGGLNMVSGYNEIMYLNENYKNELYFAIVIIFLASVILLRKLVAEKKELLKNGLIFFLFLLAAYILYKQAFTRADIQHILEFYKYILLFILCIPDFHATLPGKNHTVAIVFLIFITFFFAKKGDPELFYMDMRGSKSDYMSGFKDFTDTSGLHLFPNTNQLPAGIKNKIRRSSIDVYPWNSQLLLENRMNYTPRPAFQSYLAYTPYLENLNFEFYNSEKAPAFVLYEYEAIDGRYPLFDEPKVNFMLLNNYTCVDSFSFSGRPQLILKKNSVKKVTFKKIREYTIHITDMLVPKAGVYYEVFVANTFSGKLISLLHHAPALALVIKTKDGNEREYRTSIKLLEAGIFSDHAVTSTNHFYSAIKKDSAGVVSDIAGYSIHAKHPALFKDLVNVIEYTAE